MIYPRCPDCDIECNDAWICPLCGEKYTGSRVESVNRPTRSDTTWALEVMALCIAAVEACPEVQPELKIVYDAMKAVAEGVREE